MRPPVCNHLAIDAGMANVITPFWKRLPRFVSYPASPSTLGVLAVIAILSALSFRASLFGALVQIALFFAFLRYGYAVLLQTARGRLTPPPLSRETLIEDIELPFKQALVFIAMGVLTVTAYGLVGAFAASALNLLFLLAVPATAMVITIDRSFLRALNPVALFGIVRRVGWSYLLLYCFLLLFWSGASAVISIFFGQLPDAAFVTLYAFASMYLMLSMFNVTGYVIYQFHEQLGFGIDVGRDDAGETAPRTREATTRGSPPTEANVAVAEENLPEAIARLQVQVRAAPAEQGVRRRLHELLKLSKRREDMLRHAREWLAQLLADRRYQQALDLVHDCLPADPQFRPEEAAQIYPLASFAHQTHDDKTALYLLSGFARRHPGHADIPRAYLLAAKLLCEAMKQEAQAKKLLEDLLRRYPRHELAPAIKNYLGVVTDLVAQTGPR